MRCGPGPGSGTGTAPVASTRRVERVLAASGAQHAVGNAGSRLAKPHVDAERRQVVPQRGVVHRAGQSALGQRRPVIRRPVLGADQRDRAAVAPGPQLLDGAQARQPGSGYHDSLYPHDHLG